MQQIIFNLEDQEFITLVNLLKYENIISSGGEINFLIQEEQIKYNGKIENRKRKKLYQGDKVIINDEIEILIK